MAEQKKTQIVLQKPDASEEYSKRPNRKPDVSSRARFEGWIEEGVYLVSSAVQRPEMKHEKIIAQKGFSVSKTGGEKKQSIVLNCSDGERLKIYHRKKEKKIEVNIVLDASKSRELIYAEFTTLHAIIFKTIGGLKL